MKTFVRKSDIAIAEKFIGGGENWAQIEALCAKANAKCKALPDFAIGIDQDPGDQMLARARFELELGDWLVYQDGFLAKCEDERFQSIFIEYHGKTAI